MIHTYDLLDAATGQVTVTVYDTEAQTVTTTVDGGEPEVRPFTDIETEEFVTIDAAVVTQTNTAQMVAEQDESVDKLVLVIENLNALTALTNADINDNPAAIIKDLARECKTIARVANREARITSSRTESTDTGPVTDV